MIIRIEDLPDGQKIKRLNVDIEFDEHGEVESISKEIEPVASVLEEALELPPVESTDKPLPPPSRLIKEESRPQERKKKDIPDEMKDMEF